MLAGTCRGGSAAPTAQQGAWRATDCESAASCSCMRFSPSQRSARSTAAAVAQGCSSSAHPRTHAPCHRAQTNINAEGFRSLREGETVEFEVETGPDGRAKAINVTGPEGATPQVRMAPAARAGPRCPQTSPSRLAVAGYA